MDYGADYRLDAIHNLCRRLGVALRHIGRVVTLGKWVVVGRNYGKTCANNAYLVDVDGSCRGVALRALWGADAGLLGGADSGSYGVDCRLSGGSIGGCGIDCIVPTITLARWRIFGLGIHLFGRYIPYDGYDRVGTTLHNVVPLLLLYGTLYRPGGTRLGVVVFDVESGGNVVVLSAAVTGARKVEEGVG